MICHDDYDNYDYYDGYVDYNSHDDYDDHDYIDDNYDHNGYDVVAIKIFLKKYIAAIWWYAAMILASPLDIISG